MFWFDIIRGCDFGSSCCREPRHYLAGGAWVKGLARKTSRGIATVGPGVSYLLASSYILLTAHDTVITI